MNDRKAGHLTGAADLAEAAALPADVADGAAEPAVAAEEWVADEAVRWAVNGRVGLEWIP